MAKRLKVSYSDLFIVFDPSSSLQKSDSSLFSDRHFSLHSDNKFNKPRLFEFGSKLLILYGYPIVDGVRGDELLIQNIKKNKFKFVDLDTIDGSFLIIFVDQESRSLKIINDRFASFPIYYSIYERKFVASLSFRSLFSFLQDRNSVEIDENAITSFLWLRKVLGERTFAKNITFLRSGSLLHFQEKDLAISQYWVPEFSEKLNSADEIVDRLSESLQSSVTEQTGDNKTYALMLSGGLDARAVLAASNNINSCITAGLSQNNEFQVASELAAIENKPHVFVKQRLKRKSDFVDRATQIAGMQVYNEAQFLDYEENISEHADVVLTGIGLDIMFAGLYLPKKQKKFLGRNIPPFDLLDLPTDLASFYLNNVKYRLTTSNLSSVMSCADKQQVFETLKNQVDEILDRGKQYAASDYDLWEFLHTHNFSRHYSFPMLFSMQSYAEVRTPALSNKLFDLSNSMTAHQKLNGDLYQKAVFKLNPKLMSVRNANTNFPAGWSLNRQSLFKILLFAPHRFSLTTFGKSPEWFERSWPLPRAYLDESEELKQRILNLPICPVLQSISCVDCSKIETLVNEHMLGTKDHTVLLNLLLTVSSVLRKV